MAMNKDVLSKALQAGMVAKGALLKDADGNDTPLADVCDIIADNAIKHIKTFAAFSIVKPHNGTIAGSGGGVPGPVSGTAVIASGSQIAGSGWIK